jgi:hypothetical protein
MKRIMCNLYSITTNQAAIAALFRVVNRYVGNLAPMPRWSPPARRHHFGAVVGVANDLAGSRALSFATHVSCELASSV